MKHITEEQRAARRAYNRSYNAKPANQAKAKARAKARYEANREQRREANRAYNADPANKAKKNARAKAWREANREEWLASQRAYKAANREKVRLASYEYRAKTKFSRYEENRANWTKQNRRRPLVLLARNEASLGRPKPDTCEACGRNDVRIMFDHCHKKGHPRGWICQLCNSALGMVDDDRDLLLKLIAYLDRTKDGTSPQLALSGI